MALEAHFNPLAQQRWLSRSELAQVNRLRLVTSWTTESLALESQKCSFPSLP